MSEKELSPQHINFNGTVKATIAQPDRETVHWNTDEYQVEYIDLEKGEILFKRLDVEK